MRHADGMLTIIQGGRCDESLAIEAQLDRIERLLNPFLKRLDCFELVLNPYARRTRRHHDFCQVRRRLVGKSNAGRRPRVVGVYQAAQGQHTARRDLAIGEAMSLRGSQWQR